MVNKQRNYWLITSDRCRKQLFVSVKVTWLNFDQWWCSVAADDYKIHCWLCCVCRNMQCIIWSICCCLLLRLSCWIEEKSELVRNNYYVCKCMQIHCFEYIFWNRLLAIILEFDVATKGSDCMEWCFDVKLYSVWHWRDEVKRRIINMGLWKSNTNSLIKEDM